MKKYLNIEVYVDDSVEDCFKCANEVINEALSHHCCCDGTVQLRILEDDDEIGAEMLKRIENDNGKRYTSKDAIARRNSLKNKK